MDKIAVKLISMVILAALGTGNVIADQRNQNDERDRGRAERSQDNRRDYDARQQDNGRQNPPVDNQRQRDDNGRRNGRMTQEEKQALRRQINEAGHDIYAPRR